MRGPFDSTTAPALSFVESEEVGLSAIASAVKTTSQVTSIPSDSPRSKIHSTGVPPKSVDHLRLCE
jgi:hypothetical protein